VYLCVRMYVYLCTYVCMRVCVCVCVYVFGTTSVFAFYVHQMIFANKKTLYGYCIAITLVALLYSWVCYDY